VHQQFLYIDMKSRLLAGKTDVGDTTIVFIHDWLANFLVKPTLD